MEEKEFVPPAKTTSSADTDYDDGKSYGSDEAYCLLRAFLAKAHHEYRLELDAIMEEWRNNIFCRIREEWSVSIMPEQLWTFPAGTWVTFRGVHYRLDRDTSASGGISPQQAVEEYKKRSPDEQWRIDRGEQVLMLLGSVDAMMKKASGVL